MEGWRRPEPSGTNRPSFSFARRETTRRGGHPPGLRAPRPSRGCQATAPPGPAAAGRTESGGYGGGAPPLPIPNREVKPARADGTAHERGRVGRRHLARPPDGEIRRGALFFALPARVSPAAASLLGGTPPRLLRKSTLPYYFPSHCGRRRATTSPCMPLRPPPPPNYSAATSQTLHVETARVPSPAPVTYLIANNAQQTATLQQRMRDAVLHLAFFLSREKSLDYFPKRSLINAPIAEPTAVYLLLNVPHLGQQEPASRKHGYRVPHFEHVK